MGAPLRKFLTFDRVRFRTCGFLYREDRRRLTLEPSSSFQTFWSGRAQNRLNSSTTARATGPRAPNRNAQKAPWAGIWPSRAVGACPRAIPQARGIVPSDLFSTNEHYMYACAGSAQWFMHAWTRQWTLMACSSCACAVLTLYYMLHMPCSLCASPAPVNTARITPCEGELT